MIIIHEAEIRTLEDLMSVQLTVLKATHDSYHQGLYNGCLLARCTLLSEEYKPVNSRGHYDSAEIGEIGG